MSLWTSMLLGLLSACGTTNEAAVTPDAEPVERPASPIAAAPATRPAVSDNVASAPNVLVIVLDTVRADRMGVYGYDKPTTPRIDAWAAERAMVYERAISPGVWTLPSHASLFTALPVRSHGVTADRKWLDDDFLTAAEAFRDVGYDTFAFVANPHISSDTNVLAGFDHREHPWSPKWRRKAAKLLRDKLIAEDASTAVSPKWKGAPGASQNKYLFKESGIIAEQALLAWVGARQDQGRPFFAFLNYMEAHLPRIPRMSSRKAVMSPEAIARSMEVVQTTTSFHEHMVGVSTLSSDDLEAVSGVYDASLIDLDQDIGHLLDSLDAAGLTENTIVVITSDHGELLGEDGLLLHKYTVHNALARVPLLISWPGHQEVGRHAAPVSVADAIPLAVELGDIPLDPKTRTRLSNRATTTQDGVVTEFNSVADGSLRRMGRLHPGIDLARFERTFQSIELGSYKWVEGSDGSTALFDVLRDPGQRAQLLEPPGDATTSMQGAMRAWRKAVPEYNPKGDAPERALSEELKQGLEALGYVE